jgi:hypothetical protein
MDKKKILIISGIIATIGIIITIIIVKGKKSSLTTGTAINPTTGAKVPIAQAVASTPGATTNPWIRFNWFGGQESGAATGIQLTNVAELPNSLGPGTNIEIKMDASSTQALNGIYKVKYLGDDSKPGDFLNDAARGIITLATPTPANPTNLPKSGYFRVV